MFNSFTPLRNFFSKGFFPHQVREKSLQKNSGIVGFFFQRIFVIWEKFL